MRPCPIVPPSSPEPPAASASRSPRSLPTRATALTVTARKPDSLEQAADALRAKGVEVEAVAANVADDERDPRRGRPPPRALRPARRPREQRRRRASARRSPSTRPSSSTSSSTSTSARSCSSTASALELLRAAGAEHRNALVVNLASMAGKSPQPWLSVYSATKAAVVAYTKAMNKELNAEGVKSVAFCPGFVDTDMSDFIKESIPAEEMLRTERHRRGSALPAPASRRPA